MMLPMAKRGQTVSTSGTLERFSTTITKLAGSTGAFAIALGVIVVWALLGPLFGFSNTWQLVINTGTTIITFLMVFLIQNTQNRDSEAAHLKLDELIRALEGAHNALLDLEELDDKDLDKMRATYSGLAESARQLLSARGADTGVPNIDPVPAQEPLRGSPKRE
jgi:low affinity Fe/Cu permease